MFSPPNFSTDFDFAALARNFLRFGLVSVVGVDSNNEESTRKLCRLVAPYCNTIYEDFWTFGAEEATFSSVKEKELAREDTAYSQEAIGPHTDGTYLEQPPGIQVFHCLKSGKEGGETLLVDGFSAAEQLRNSYPKFFEILCRTPIEHHYLEGLSGNSSGERKIYARAMQNLVISLLGDKITQIRYNPYDRAPMRSLRLGEDSKAENLEKTVEFYEAYEKFSQIINSPHQALRVMLQPGTVVFLDNFRVLHGRTAFTGSRKICGSYLSRDGFLAKARPLL